MKRITFILLAACLCLSCSSADNGTEPQEQQEPAKRTVLIYMAADNNLYRQEQRDDVLFSQYSLLDWYKDSGLFCIQ
ncbi:MAG: hypothetical protein LBC64_05895 [Fibromonadaceae bacterium]|nr:hypothetical protein [Fibromonadaceae bacterium]